MADVADPRTTAQEALEELTQKIGDAGHEAALTAVGLAALGVVGAQELWKNREEVLEKAATRGVDVESDAVAFFRQAEERVNERVDTLHSVRKRALRPGGLLNKLAYKLRDRVDSELARQGFSHDVPESQEIEISMTRDGQASGRTVVASDGVDVPAASGAASRNPISNYEGMTAKEIVSQITSLSVDELEIVREYEEQMGSRVTILRAIERRLAAIR